MNARSKASILSTSAVAGGLAVIAVLLLFAPTFFSMAAIWNRDATFTHGYIIPLLSAWLLWRDRDALAAQRIAPDYRVFWLIAALLIAWLAADLLDVKVIRQAAATALIPAGLWATLGSKWARRATFPLAYLLFAVPFGDFLVPSLVQFTTEFTVAAVRLVGVPIYRDGNTFSLPSGNFEVIKACSGVRYLIATIALGTLFAALSYRTWPRRIAFMALCLVVPVIANGMRAFGIVMIAHLSNLKYAVGFDHLIYGWVFFGVVMLLLFWLGGKFANPSPPYSAAPDTQISHRIPWTALSAFVALLLVATATSWLIQQRSTIGSMNNAAPRLKDAMQVALGGWRGPLAIVDVWQPAFVDATLASESGRYRASVGEVSVFVRQYAWHFQNTAEATTAPLVTDQQMDWRVDVKESETHGDHVVDVAEIVGRNNNNARWRVWRWYLIDGQTARGRVQAKLLELNAWLYGRPPRTTVICVAVSMRDGNSNTLQGAEAVLEDFSTAFSWQLLSQPVLSQP